MINNKPKSIDSGVQVLFSFMCTQSTSFLLTEEVFDFIFRSCGHVYDCVVKSHVADNHPLEGASAITEADSGSTPTEPAKFLRQGGYGFVTFADWPSAERAISDIRLVLLPKGSLATNERSMDRIQLLQRDLREEEIALLGLTSIENPYSNYAILDLDCKLSRTASAQKQKLVSKYSLSLSSYPVPISISATSTKSYQAPGAPCLPFPASNPDHQNHTIRNSLSVVSNVQQENFATFVPTPPYQGVPPSNTVYIPYSYPPLSFSQHLMPNTPGAPVGIRGNDGQPSIYMSPVNFPPHPQSGSPPIHGGTPPTHLPSPCSSPLIPQGGHFVNGMHKNSIRMSNNMLPHPSFQQPVMNMAPSYLTPYPSAKHEVHSVHMSGSSSPIPLPPVMLSTCGYQTLQTHNMPYPPNVYAIQQD